MVNPKKSYEPDTNFLMYFFFEIHIPIVFLIASKKKFLDSYYCSDIHIDINGI